MDWWTFWYLCISWYVSDFNWLVYYFNIWIVNDTVGIWGCSGAHTECIAVMQVGTCNRWLFPFDFPCAAYIATSFGSFPFVNLYPYLNIAIIYTWNLCLSTRFILWNSSDTIEALWTHLVMQPYNQNTAATFWIPTNDDWLRHQQALALSVLPPTTPRPDDISL